MKTELSDIFSDARNKVIDAVTRHIKNVGSLAIPHLPINYVDEDSSAEPFACTNYVDGIKYNDDTESVEVSYDGDDGWTQDVIELSMNEIYQLIQMIERN